MTPDLKYRSRVISPPLEGGILGREMRRIGVHPAGASVMEPKARVFAVKVRDVSATRALILKQEALASGAEAAIASGVVSREVDATDCIVIGTLPALTRLAEKLDRQPFDMGEIGRAVLGAIENYTSSGYTVPCAHGVRLELDRPFLMGIVNVTPDSFSDGGRLDSTGSAARYALKLAADGADVIDVGGESTRPGAEAVSETEEIERTVPVIRAVRKETDVPVSIDTTRASVAEAAIEAGANIVNDVSAMTLDARMAEVAAGAGAGVVLMHMQGTPRNMQDDPRYDDVTGEVSDFLDDVASRAEDAGVERESIILDPGIGFGKNLAHNVELMSRVGVLKSLGYPVLVGPSRKMWLGMMLGRDVSERLAGTIAAVAALVMRGVSILRVHDVACASDAVSVARSILEGRPAGEVRK